MSALTTNTTIKGDGLKFNVRSYKLERVIDFAALDFTASTYFEIGDLPAGFIPRAIGLLELVKQIVGSGGDANAATLGVYLKSDSSKLVERTLGTAAGNTFALLTAAATSLASEVYTTALTPKAVAGSLCAHVNNKPTNGKIKVVIAGDMMSDSWDDGIKNVEPFDPSEAVPANTSTATA